MNNLKYSLPVALAAGFLALPALAGDVSKHKNEMRNEMALSYLYGFNDTYHVAFEVFGQKNGNDRLDSSLLSVNERTPQDENEIWGNDDVRADFDWTTGVRLRPGMNVTPTTRLFLDSGVVWGDFSMELTNLNSGAFSGSDELEASDTLRGFRYGAGIEQHLPYVNALSLVLDYSMTQFEETELLYHTQVNNPDVETDPLYAPAYQQVMLTLKAEFDSGLGF